MTRDGGKNNKGHEQAPPTPEEIRRVYAMGEEAVVRLVEGLVKLIAQQEARIQALEDQWGKTQWECPVE